MHEQHSDSLLAMADQDTAMLTWTHPASGSCTLPPQVVGICLYIYMTNFAEIVKGKQQVPGNWLTPPPTEETSTILPEPRAFMPGSTAFTSHREPSAFTCHTQCHAGENQLAGKPNLFVQGLCDVAAQRKAEMYM